MIILLACQVSGNPTTKLENQNDDLWIPNLRGIPIGREGEIVAEFEVSVMLFSSVRVTAPGQLSQFCVCFPSNAQWSQINDIK